MCTNESLNTKHDIRIKWVRKFGVCCTNYTSFGKFGTPKTNGRAPKTRFSALSYFFETLAHTWIKLGTILNIWINWVKISSMLYKLSSKFRKIWRRPRQSPKHLSVYVSKSYSMPMAKQARQIWTKKLGLVHPLSFSGVIFREIGHLARIPIFWSNQRKKSTNFKTRMGPRDLQN